MLTDYNTAPYKRKKAKQAEKNRVVYNIYAYQPRRVENEDAELAHYQGAPVQ
jgi:hypothetical protein